MHCPLPASVTDGKLLRPHGLLGLLAASLVGYAADVAPAPGPGSSVVVDPNSRVELNKVEAVDDEAQAEVDKWIAQNNAFKLKGAGVLDTELERRITERFEPVRRAYEEFLRRHPDDARGHLLYGSFLNARQDEQGAQVHWEKALQLDPANPAVYNNLAGRYSESGPVNKAFEFFAKAIEMAPTEPVYFHNFADCLYVLRKRAASYYRISEQQVYAKALLLYSNASRLDRTNFAYARDLAQTYYSVKPLPVPATLSAWSNALSVAHEETDREEVFVHLARVKMLAGRLAEARAQLEPVTNAAWLPAKTTLLLSIEQRAKEPGTNALPALKNGP